MLRLNNIHKYFGEREILSGLNLEVNAGQIHTLMGANGTGKTTLFNIITGFQKADIGMIFFKERNITNYTPIKINHLRITRTFQNIRLIEGLTVKENILLSFRGNKGENIFNSMLPRVISKEYDREFDQKACEVIEQIFLNDVAENKAGEISYGQQKLLTLGCSIANDAELFLLDEPVAGINPNYREKISLLIKKIKAHGKTILLIEHSTDFIKKISDKIFFLSNGGITEFESFEILENSNIVKDAYL